MPAYLKGRDWFDFNWYTKLDVSPNLPLLQAALTQYGPWQDQTLAVDSAWLREALLGKIAVIDWQAAAQDVERFLGTNERASLKLWNERFFSEKVSRLARN
jgi:hypothetical protein